MSRRTPVLCGLADPTTGVLCRLLAGHKLNHAGPGRSWPRALCDLMDVPEEDCCCVFHRTPDRKAGVGTR